MTLDVRICSDETELVAAACFEVLRAARWAWERGGAFTWVLAGGSTPTPVYAALRQERDFDWARTEVFWGDERCVPPDDADSNYRLAKTTLLDHVPLRSSQIHRMTGEAPPERAADQYADELARWFAQDGPDLVLLGMGADGHTASLFPGLTAVAERRRWVVPEFVPQMGSWRLSCTPVFLNRARRIVFLVAGAAKAAALAQVLEGPRQPCRWPAQAIQGPDQCWLVEQSAATHLLRYAASAAPRPTA